MFNKYHLISDFNIEPLKGFLINLDKNAKVTVAPYGQVIQEIYNNNLDNENQIFIWTFPQSIIPTFSDAIKLHNIEEKACLKEVKKYCEAIIELSKKCKCVYLASWVLENKINSYGMLDWKPGLGISNILAKMNILMADLLNEYKNIYILNTQFWIQNTEKVIPKIWYATKVPYSQLVYKNAANTIHSASIALNGSSKKLIILDLDNTLWGGVVGELGIEGIILGGHDYKGEAFKEFQQTLLTLSNRGIQLAIVSKNDENVALEVINKHDQMVLKKENFVSWRINWKDKATNIKSILKELNLGLSSAIFIDDNAVERDWVRKSLPEILVPEWPNDPTHYVTELAKLNYLDIAYLSDEDRNRTKMYLSERERKAEKEKSVSLTDWLISLDTKVTVHLLNKNNINRVTQLFNKTNQLNLRTRRMNQEEILKWMAINKKNKIMYIVDVKDRIGDLGIVGIISCEIKGLEINIEDFILSCRVMGRKIEEFMLWLAINFAKKNNVSKIKAEFIPTKRNRPTFDILQKSIFKNISNNLFEDESNINIEIPKELKINSTLIEE